MTTDMDTRAPVAFLGLAIDYADSGQVESPPPSFARRRPLDADAHRSVLRGRRSATGAEAVPGVRVAVTANHWRLAIESHQASHPDTAHDCADISQVDPRRYPTTDILWAFPSCTNHSIAKGDGTPSPSRGVSHRLARPSRSQQAPARRRCCTIARHHVGCRQVCRTSPL